MRKIESKIQDQSTQKAEFLPETLKEMDIWYLDLLKQHSTLLAQPPTW